MSSPMMSIQKNMKKVEDRALLKLRLLIGKLQKGLLLLATRVPHDHLHNHIEEESATVPEDVKEGHFAVCAVKGNETKRFVAKLESLNNPAFMKLLEQAKEEYGFEHKGTLVVPCRPEELHRILENCRTEKTRPTRAMCNSDRNIFAHRSRILIS